MVDRGQTFPVRHSRHSLTYVGVTPRCIAPALKELVCDTEVVADPADDEARRRQRSRTVVTVGSGQTLENANRKELTMLRMFSLVLVFAGAILLQGSTSFDASGADPETGNALAVDRGVAQDENGEGKLSADNPADEIVPAGKFSVVPLRIPAARWIVTIGVANDIGTIRAGDMIDLMIPAVGEAAGVLPESPPPSEEQILQSLPTKDRTGQVTRDKVRIDVEQLANRLEEVRHFPLVGVAQVHSRHYKCTVHSRKTTQSDSPDAPGETKESSEVTYFDLSRLVSPIGKSVAENVQVVGTTNDRNALENGDRLLIAVTGAQVIKLKAASLSTTLYVRPRAAKQP